MVKISQLFEDTAPTLDDYIPGNDASGPTTKRTLWSTIRDLLFGNIPTTAPGGEFDYVISGGVWSADSAGVNRNASMTAMVCRINGRKISIAAVVGRTFTASKDTYIDVLDNGDGTGTLVYTEVSNNAASPALAANSVRIGIIVTGATTIANSGSINQGEEGKLLPIASSQPYETTDSLGNLICNRNSSPGLLGRRQVTSNVSSGGTGHNGILGLSCPVKVPTGRKVKITLHCGNLVSGSANQPNISIWDGTVGSGTQLDSASGVNVAGTGVAVDAFGFQTPATSSKTYNAGLQQPVSGSATLGANSTAPAFILVELE